MLYLQKEPWSESEDIILIEAHKEFGKRWSKIARRIPGRPENDIKNHWYAVQRKHPASGRPSDDSGSRSTLLKDYISTLESGAHPTVGHEQDAPVNADAKNDDAGTSLPPPSTLVADESNAVSDQTAAKFDDFDAEDEIKREQDMWEMLLWGY